MRITMWIQRTSKWKHRVFNRPIESSISAGAESHGAFCTRATMIGDSAFHRVFKINELARAITSRLIPTSQKSIVKLACTCRYLEELALSALWETQIQLYILVRLLPGVIWDDTGDIEGVRGLDLSLETQNAHVRSHQYRIVGDPSPEAWNRVQRYASWMRRVHADSEVVIMEDTVRQIRLNSPAGGWFPALRVLEWTLSKHSLLYIDLLFSPLLEQVYVDTSNSWKNSWNNSGSPHDILSALASTISALPTSALQTLSVGTAHSVSDPWWAHLEDSFSSVVLRCGPSLTHLSSPIRLSDEAVDHVIRLPGLRVWEVVGSPPSCSTLSPPFVFPPLTTFKLGEPSARGWLSLFQRLEARTSATQDVTPLYKLKKSVGSLSVGDRFTASVIDNSLTSTIQIFRNLLVLYVGCNCSEGSEGQCSFKLNNDDVAALAMALPQLLYLLLGLPCSNNTCTTTVACLLPISVYCVGLGALEIHFNTTNIVDDLKNLSADPQFRKFHSLRRCRLSTLDVCAMPLVLNESDFGTVVDGMRYIFPNLRNFRGQTDSWRELSRRLRGF